MTRPPVLFLHGIRGSSLVQEKAGRQQLLWNLAGEFRRGAEALALKSTPDGRASALLAGVHIRAAAIEDAMYGDFLREQQKQTRVIAPAWDWRLSPAQALEALAGELRVLGTVDLVTHSMGAQIILEALHQGIIQSNQLRRMVFVTPPFCGSLDIVALLRDGLDCGGSDQEVERQYDSRLARSFPSLYHLLPGPGCPPPLSDWLLVSNWPKGFPQCPEERQSFITHLQNARRQGLRRRQVLMQLFKTHRESALILAGRGVTTISGIRHSLRTSRDGDGRLLVSVTHPPGCPWPSQVLGSIGRPMPHGDFLATHRGRQACNDWLNRSGKDSGQ